MRGIKTGLGVVWLLASVLAGACGGSAVSAPNQNDPDAAAGQAGTAANPSNGSMAGDESAGAAGAAGAAPSDGGGAAGDACQAQHDTPPGPAIINPSQSGSSACAGTTLADAIAQARELDPDLADVTELHTPETFIDGSYIYAFAKADGGFALVFKRGNGDCPSGCGSSDYWYFETDAACQIRAVGENHSGQCTPADQQPRWGVPAAVAPRDICGADQAPVQLSGQYDVVTCGTAYPCTLGGEKVSPRTLPGKLTVTIQQDPKDLSQGTVTLGGTGEPLLDGQPFPAKFERQSFTVHAEYTNLPATCMAQWQLDFSYDFERFGQSKLSFFELETPDCKAAPSAYCKGSISADFGDNQASKQ